MRRDRLLRAHLLERFVVTCQDGSTFDGLLADVDGQVVKMVDAGVPTSNGGRNPIDGDLYIERTRVAFLQRP